MTAGPLNCLKLDKCDHDFQKLSFYSTVNIATVVCTLQFDVAFHLFATL